MYRARGHIVKNSLRLLGRIAPRPVSQELTLRALLETARQTEYGKKHNFQKLLSSGECRQQYRSLPLVSYDEMWEKYWQYAHAGKRDITWPGIVDYFALSSGTSGAPSKRIPVTSEMIRSVQKVAFRQLITLAKSGIAESVFSADCLMIGGSTTLQRSASALEGDMSGISALNIPSWVKTGYYKPGGDIAAIPEWKQRIAQMVKHAPSWNIGSICGIPSWVQIVLEEIISHHRLKNIHELWPALSLYVHGGVAFSNYRDTLDRLCGRTLAYRETYMASEGSFAFRVNENDEGMQLVEDAGIYFEFLPYSFDTFDAAGRLRGSPLTQTLEKVSVGCDYALVISTCAGAWRYIIGDVIRFTDVSKRQIILTGRTSQSLNVCGEHVSLSNLNEAIKIVSEKLSIQITEFTVHVEKRAGRFVYSWFLGTTTGMPETIVASSLDEAMQLLNDDYKTERGAAISGVEVRMLDPSLFYAYMRSVGKEGGMNKFPRVMNPAAAALWKSFIAVHNVPHRSTVS